MGAGGATSTQGFRARAGVLTLMLTGNSSGRHKLLLSLDDLLRGGDGPEEVEPPSELDVFMDLVEEDFLLEVADESKLEPDGSVGIETPMRPSPAGKELLLVSTLTDQWLATNPELPLGRGEQAKAARDLALAVLIGGLATTALHRVALGPCSSAEVCEEVPEIGEKLLEEQMLISEHVGLIEVGEWEEGEARYVLTDWGRRSIVPVVAAARFEHRYPRGDTLAPDRLDVEMAFGFALPLLALDPDLEGRCRMAVRLPGTDQPAAGLIVEVREGRVASLEADPGDVETDPSAGADPPPGTLIGDAGAWMEELVGGDPRRSGLEGDSELGRVIVSALRDQLLPAPPGS